MTVITSSPTSPHQGQRPDRRDSTFRRYLLQYGLLIALLGVSAFFAAMSPTFLTTANFASILVNSFALPAIIAIAMTLAVGSGGIDLSVATAVDLASLAFVGTLAAGWPVPGAILAGLGAAALTGIFNGLLITGLNITPFLATLGTLFIGRSVQQVLANGGNPVYLSSSKLPAAVKFLAHGSFLGVPLPLYVVGFIALVAFILLELTIFGRGVRAIGARPQVAYFSGLRVRRDIVWIYLLSAAISGVAGILLSATVSAYIPYSGNAFLLNAIGAAFIGTTFGARGHANIIGTILGVLLLAIVANGLLLVGWNFYWQQVGTGAFIFLILAFSFASKRRQQRA
ncbi:MAG TPA: ABC transporter permease [Dongiaceae bacterium]|nr:ABC transporter permease [Dongiaceae bacterium]